MKYCMEQTLFENNKYNINTFKGKKVQQNKTHPCLFLPYILCTETYPIGHGGHLNGKEVRLRGEGVKALLHFNSICCTVTLIFNSEITFIHTSDSFNSPANLKEGRILP